MHMIHAANVRHGVLYRDEHAYCAHPFITALDDGAWLVVFNHTIRRPTLLHPPEDPYYRNLIMRSEDQGRTWSVPQVAPGYDWYGVECAGLTVLRDQSVLLNQWRFRWYPLDQARKLHRGSSLVFPDELMRWMTESGELEVGREKPPNLPEIYPWARANGGTYVHRSTDGGRTWDETVEVATAPFSGGYGMRGGVQLESGVVLLPLSDVPHYQKVFVMHSADGGRTWGAPVAAAAVDGFQFEEPSVLALPGGRVLMMLRENVSHHLFMVTSTDGGHTWSSPRRTPIWGYPPHLLALPDGRVACIYGYRRPPYGIRLVISDDGGETWNLDDQLVIRGDLPNRNLGYPAAVVTREGGVFTVYYGEDAAGVTGIMGSYLTI